jgi:H+/gluconate symporter-like permease
MDTKKANEIIKQKKKRSHISTVIVVLIAFVFAIFIQSPIKYFLVAALIIAGLIAFTKFVTPPAYCIRIATRSSITQLNRG